MRELDRDISAMLDEDLSAPDHNADKKSAAEEICRQGNRYPVFSPMDSYNILEPPHASMRREMRAVSVDSADTTITTTSPQKLTHPISSSEMNLNSDLDRLSQLGSQTQVSVASHNSKPETSQSVKTEPEMDSAFVSDFPTSEFSTTPLVEPSASTKPPGAIKPNTLSADEDRSHRVPNDSKSHAPSSDLPSFSPEKMNREKEIHVLKFAALQLSAVKALSVLASSERFAELLLVPRVSSKDNVVEKQLLDSLGIHKDEAMKASLRQMMRLFVTRSTYPSPFKRAVPLTEIERAFSVLHSAIIQHIAEDRLGVMSLEGNKPPLISKF